MASSSLSRASSGARSISIFSSENSSLTFSGTSGESGSKPRSMTNTCASSSCGSLARGADETAAARISASLIIASSMGIGVL